MERLVAAPRTNYRNQARQSLHPAVANGSAGGRPQGGKLTQEGAGAVADDNHGVRLRLMRQETGQAVCVEGPARGGDLITGVTVSFSLLCEDRSGHLWGRNLTAATEEAPLAWLSVNKSCLAHCGGLILPLLLRRRVTLTFPLSASKPTNFPKQCSRLPDLAQADSITRAADKGSPSLPSRGLPQSGGVEAPY